MENKKSFAEILRETLKKKKITQEYLAEKCLVTRQSISAYLKGKSEPPASVLISMAKTLDVPSDYLLGLCDVETYDKSKQAVTRATGLSAKSVDKIITQHSIAEDGTESTPLHGLDLLLRQDDFWQYLESFDELYVYGRMAQKIVQGQQAVDACEDWLNSNDMKLMQELSMGWPRDSMHENSEIIEQLRASMKNALYNTTITAEFFHALTARANALCNQLERTRRYIADKEEQYIEAEIRKIEPPEGWIDTLENSFDDED